MTTLRTLGGLWLDTGNGRVEGRGGQRRRLALLALLALSPNRRVTRDKALAILWPEATSTEGRRRLSTAIYDLRSALGDDALQSGGDELWIGPDATWSTDVEQFEAAWSRGETEAALAAYTGAFLDGVHLSGAGQFDEWVGNQRERLRRLYGDAIERAATERREHGDHRGAIAAASQLVELDPLSGRAAALAAGVLVDSGDRAQALRLLTAHAAGLRRELGAEPDADVRRLLQELRREPSRAFPLSDSPSSKAAASSPDVPKELGPESVDSTDSPHLPPPAASSTGRTRSRQWISVAAIGVFTSALIGAHLARSTAQPTGSRARMILEPIQVEGTVSPEVGQRIGELFAGTLRETGVFTDEESHIITGAQAATRIMRDEAQPRVVRLAAMLRDARSGASVAAAEVSGSVDSLPDVVRSLARDLAAEVFAAEGRGILASATRSAKSSAALRSFVAGEHAYKEGRFDAAVASFQTAVALDSAFALAHYRLALSLLWEEHPVEYVAVHDSLAVHYAGTLSPNDQVLIRAYAAWRRGEFALSDTLYAALWNRDRQNGEAQFQRAEVLFHYNPLRGRPIGESWAWFEGALSVDSADWGARWHLMLLDARTIGQHELRQRVAALSRSSPGGATALEMRLFVADTAGGELAGLADSASGIALFDAAWRRAVFRSDLAGAEWLLARMAQRGSTFDRSNAFAALGNLWFGQGRAREAVALLRHGAIAASDDARWVALIEGALANDTLLPPGTLDSLRTDLERWHETLGSFDRRSSSPKQASLYLAGLLAVHRGDSGAVDRLTTVLAQTPDWPADPYQPRDARPNRELARVVRAYADLRTHRCEAALRELDAPTAPQWLGLVASSALAGHGFDRFVRAECLLELGRNRDAIAWFETFEQNTLFDFEFLGPALRGQIIAHRALGEFDAARALETRLAGIQAHADRDVHSALASNDRQTPDAKP